MSDFSSWEAPQVSSPEDDWRDREDRTDDRIESVALLLAALMVALIMITGFIALWKVIF